MSLEVVAENVASQLLTDARALNQRAQEGAQQLHQLTMSNAVALQHQVQLTAASYGGSHLRRGSEVDAQEATAEGAVYKGESLASLPQTQTQHSAVLSESAVQKVADAVLSQILAKVGQNTGTQQGSRPAE